MDSPSVASNGTTIQTEAFDYLANGIFYTRASAAVSVSASAQTVSTWKIYLLSVNSGGTATATVGVGSTTAGSETFPAPPSGHTPFGYIRIKAGNVTAFTLGTTPFGVASSTQFVSIGGIASASSGAPADLSLTGL